MPTDKEAEAQSGAPTCPAGRGSATAGLSSLPTEPQDLARNALSSGQGGPSMCGPGLPWGRKNRDKREAPRGNQMESTLTHTDSLGQAIKLKQNCSGTRQIYRLLLQLLLAAKVSSWALTISVLSGLRAWIRKDSSVKALCLEGDAEKQDQKWKNEQEWLKA
ncbi:uncharacterized protein RBU33_027611 isoform 2-T4 [Hipposideros larvatus]